MSQERFIYLLNKKADRSVTWEETEELRVLLNEADQLELIDYIGEYWLREITTIKNMAVDDADADRKADLILSVDKNREAFAGRENSGEHAVRRSGLPVVPMLQRWKWAAAIVILLTGAALLYHLAGGNQPSQAVPVQAGSSDIMPGTNRAMLTLADGSTILLDSAMNGAIAQQGNASVIKLANGEIQYNSNGIPSGEVMMNTMSTPRGGQYQLRLPDGSKLWLNAASSVSYPVVFSGKERLVKISGEVYLEVIKDKSKPFVVDINGTSRVQVLGTSFNINAHADDETIKTTLIEGSIKMGESVLQPGQQAALAADKTIHIAEVDTAPVVAWKNGAFSLTGKTIPQLMGEIARWYDLDVVYEGQLRTRKLEGEIGMNLTLLQCISVLKKMEVNCKLEGRKLIVKS